MPPKLVEAPKAFTDDFTAVCDGNKGAGLSFSDKVTQFHSLASLGDSDYDRFFVVPVGTFGMLDGSTSAQFVCDKVTDRLRIVTYNCEIFAEIDVLNHAVDYERLGKQSAERTQTCLRIEHKACCDYNPQIHDEKGGTDIQLCIFFQNHCYNIRPAAGGSHVEKDGCTEGREDNGKNQLQDGLVRQRMLHGEKKLCNGQPHRSQNADIDSFNPRFFTQKEKTKE